MRGALNAGLKYLDFSKESIPNCASLKNHESNHSRSPSPARTFWSPTGPSTIVKPYPLEMSYCWEPTPEDRRVILGWQGKIGGLHRDQLALTHHESHDVGPLPLGFHLVMCPEAPCKCWTGGRLGEPPQTHLFLPVCRQRAMCPLRPSSLGALQGLLPHDLYTCELYAGLL